MMNLTNMINLVDESRYNESNMNAIVNELMEILEANGLITNCDMEANMGSDIANTTIDFLKDEFDESIENLDEDERAELEEVFEELNTDEFDAWELIRDKVLEEQDAIYNTLRANGLVQVAFSDYFREENKIGDWVYMEVWTTAENLEELKDSGLLNQYMDINEPNFIEFC